MDSKSGVCKMKLINDKTYMNMGDERVLTSYNPGILLFMFSVTQHVKHHGEYDYLTVSKIQNIINKMQF